MQSRERTTILPEIKEYLDDVRSHLHLDPAVENQIIGELHTYFQDKILELQENGIPLDEAAKEAMKSFGRTKVLARLMYEAYSKGNWAEALLSALPHIIVAGLFFSHLWYHPILAPITFAMIVCVTLFGWWYGKPNWLYSWIGYALLPLIIGGYAFYPALEQAASFIFWGNGSLPDIATLLLICAFFILSLWVIIGTTMRVVKRDWILASLMLVPLPILGSWLFNIERMGGLFQGGYPVFHQWDIPMSLVLSVLATASTAFVRLRKRILKGIALMTLAFISMTIIGHILWEDQGFFGLLATSILSLLFLISPRILETRMGHGELRGEALWSDDWIENPSGTK
jgi:hypothetical protein